MGLSVFPKDMSICGQPALLSHSQLPHDERKTLIHFLIFISFKRSIDSIDTSTLKLLQLLMLYISYAIRQLHERVCVCVGRGR